MEGKIPISFLIFCLGCIILSSAFEDEREILDLESDMDFEKRPLEYVKKPYNYLIEYKRLPQYNFGVGKRSTQHGFGLGKRYLQEEDILDEDDYPFVEEWPESDLLAEGEDVQVPDKRRKMYLFGLGKRVPSFNFGVGKRHEKMGSFGFGLGKRNEKFTFGLGKRDEGYSFGVGKRAFDSDSGVSRFKFGVGKRSGEYDLDELRSKEEAATSPDRSLLQNLSIPGKIGQKNEKRSKNTALPPNNFSRRNRKPLSFDFGMGKRNPYYNFGMGKRNYPNNDYVF